MRCAARWWAEPNPVYSAAPPLVHLNATARDIRVRIHGPPAGAAPEAGGFPARRGEYQEAEAAGSQDMPRVRAGRGRRACEETCS